MPQGRQRGRVSGEQSRRCEAVGKQVLPRTEVSPSLSHIDLRNRFNLPIADPAVVFVQRRFVPAIQLLR